MICVVSCSKAAHQSVKLRWTGQAAGSRVACSALADLGQTSELDHVEPWYLRTGHKESCTCFNLYEEPK